MHVICFSHVLLSYYHLNDRTGLSTFLGGRQSTLFITLETIREPTNMLKQRKTFMVNKEIQGALGWRIAIHWMIFLGLSIAVTCSLQVLSSFDQGSLWSRLETALKGQFGSIAVLLALLPWFVHDLLKFSNRFAAPVMRLQRSIIQLANEDQAPPLVIRSGDFWQKLATDFNDLRTRVQAEREQLTKASSSKGVAESPKLPAEVHLQEWQESKAAAFAESAL